MVCWVYQAGSLVDTELGNRLGNALSSPSAITKP